MDCKRALEESNGDIGSATDILRKKGIAAAQKRSGRTAAEGVVAYHVDADSGTGALVEMNCETDFVAKNDEFSGLASSAAKAIAASKPTPDTVLDTEIPGQSGSTIGSLIESKTAKIGENILLKRFEIIEARGDSHIASYIHLGGKIGVLIEMGTGGNHSEKADEVARNIAMHIAALSPEYIKDSDVPESVVAKEKEIYLDQAKQSGKPEKVMEKIVEGRLRKFYQEICLIEQNFVKEPDLKVKKYLDREGREIRASFEIKRFVRFQIGEESGD